MSHGYRTALSDLSCSYFVFFASLRGVIVSATGAVVFSLPRNRPSGQDHVVFPSNAAVASPPKLLDCVLRLLRAKHYSIVGTTKNTKIHEDGIR
jgi:hypothetical protein